jgi:pyridoxine 5-phosphate synthase
VKAELTKSLNFEMATTREMVDIALKARPHAACIAGANDLSWSTET